MKKTYKINEIFYSLQGEGYYTGHAAVFLRFAGCNRKCDFCDTDHFGFTEMTAEQVVDEVSRYAARHIVITGGEPTLQLDGELLSLLKSAGFYVQIETNGTMAVPTGVDWVTCSPKAEPWGIDRVDELKVVYQGQDVEAIAERLPAAKYHYLQPCSGRNVKETVDYILANPRWRLSLQTHKLIDIQ
jgi:organic radical activating enzyme